MNRPSITRIPILPFGMVHCHLVVDVKGCVLVDTGTPGSEDKIERALKKHGLGFRDVTLIVVTHAHTDHAGLQPAVFPGAAPGKDERRRSMVTNALSSGGISAI